MEADFIFTSSPLFTSLSRWELTEIGRNLTNRRYRAGEMVFRQGEIGDRLFIVNQGLVEISSTGEQGDVKVIARLGRGDCFGEMSLLTGESRSANAAAASELELLVLQQADFLGVVGKCPALARNIGRILSERLQRTNAQLLQRHKKGDLTILDGLPGTEEAGLLAFNIAVSLSRQAGKRVLLVLDPETKMGRTVSPARAPLPPLTALYEDRELLRQYEQYGGNPELAGLTVASLSANGAPGLDAAFLLTTTEWLREVYGHVLLTVDLARQPAPALPLNTEDRVIVLGEEALLAGAGPLPELDQCLAMTKNVTLVAMGRHGESQSSGATGSVRGWPVRRRVILRPELLAGASQKPFVLNAPGAALSKDVDWIARDIGRLKVGIALGAGGAKGYALLGALKVLEAEGVPFDYLSGTSIGSIVGAWLATGLSVEETRRLMIESFNPEAVKKIFAVSLSGFSAAGTQEMAALLERTLGDRQFGDLAIPLVAIAVDLRSRQEVALADGLVREAVQASVSLPGTFPPLALGERLLVDGVALNPVPSAPLRALGADIVIGINLISREQLPVWPGEEPTEAQPAPRRGVQMLDSLFQVMDIMQTETSERCAGQADVAITPAFGPCSWRDFARAQQFQDAGERAALEARSALRQVLPWLRS